jgi:hypothetical protein
VIRASAAKLGDPGSVTKQMQLFADSSSSRQKVTVRIQILPYSILRTLAGKVSSMTKHAYFHEECRFDRDSMI